jgi:hypothetical protein
MSGRIKAIASATSAVAVAALLFTGSSPTSFLLHTQQYGRFQNDQIIQ